MVADETGGGARVGQVASGEAAGRRVVEPFSRCYPRRSNGDAGGGAFTERTRGGDADDAGRAGDAGERVGEGENARARRAYLVFASQSSSMVFPECATSINMVVAWAHRRRGEAYWEGTIADSTESSRRPLPRAETRARVHAALDDRITRRRCARRGETTQ